MVVALYLLEEQTFQNRLCSLVIKIWIYILDINHNGPAFTVFSNKIQGKIIKTASFTKLKIPLRSNNVDQDRALMVKMLVNKNWGVLSISGTGVKLEIPPGAMLEEQLIKMPAVLTLPHCLVLKKDEKRKAKVYSSSHKGGMTDLEYQINTLKLDVLHYIYSYLKRCLSFMIYRKYLILSIICHLSMLGAW